MFGSLPFSWSSLMTSFIADSNFAERNSDAKGQYVPLEQIVRPVLTTAEAAHYLNRKPQTLRIWACTEAGPIRPVRVYGRLGWRLSDVRRCLGIDQPGGPKQ